MSELDESMDMNTQMMLDGNALAGKLQTIFGGRNDRHKQHLCPVRRYEHDG